jgi:hypothetical protein
MSKMLGMCLALTIGLAAIPTTVISASAAPIDPCIQRFLTEHSFRCCETSGASRWGHVECWT